MKRVVKASEDVNHISGVHIVDSKSQFGGYVKDRTWSGTKSELLSLLAAKSGRYVANSEDRFIIILAHSNISHSMIDEVTSTDNFYEAEEWAEDWIDSNSHKPAREFVMRNFYYASVVDTLRGREIFYDRQEGKVKEW